MTDYALALAHYAFWRHPPGILRWLTVGAVAAMATQNMRDYAWFITNIGQQYFFLGARRGWGWHGSSAPRRSLTSATCWPTWPTSTPTSAPRTASSMNRARR
jgi:hypothetical protein